MSKATAQARALHNKLHGNKNSKLYSGHGTGEEGPVKGMKRLSTQQVWSSRKADKKSHKESREYSEYLASRS